MGLNLRGLLQPAALELADLAGERVAVDAYGLFYQYLTMLRDVRGDTLKDAQGNTTSHLVGLVARTEELLAAGITPVYVLDGPPHPLKMATLARRAAAKDVAADRLEAARAEGDIAGVRRHAAQTARVTKEIVASARALLDACGIPVVSAPGDAEAQCAVLAAQGRVDAAASQDYDTLVYGAPRVVRNLTAAQRAIEEHILAAVLHSTGLDRERLVDLAILVGNDFFPGVKGIGAKTALRLLAAHGTLEGILAAPQPHGAARRVAAAQHQFEDGTLDDVRRIFLAPEVDPDAAVSLHPPDASSIHERLVEVHGFSPARADRFACEVVDHYEARHARHGRLERPLAIG